MKHPKRILSIALSLILVLSMSVTAFLASDNENGTDHSVSGVPEDGQFISDLSASENAPEAGLNSLTSQSSSSCKVIHINDNLYLSGNLPENAVAEADPVQIEIDGEYVLQAFEIRIYANENQQKKGHVWQQGSNQVTIHLHSDADDGQFVKVYGFAFPEGQPQELYASQPADGWIEFPASQVSIYAVSVLKKTISVSDGTSYRASVTYGPASTFPVDADIQIQTFSGSDRDNYLSQAASLLGASDFSYASVFDIRILDEDRTVLQPVEAVEVTLTLLDSGKEADYSVIHFGTEPELIPSKTEHNSVTFFATGFSAYAIVQGPGTVPTGWYRIQNLEELAEFGSQGLYIGHKDGYYFTDGITADSTRSGITKTKPAQSYPSEGAVPYYFEQVDGSNYKVYCLIEDVKTYIVQTDNSLSLSSDEGQATIFTIENGSPTPAFRAKGTNGYYWNMQGGANGTRFCTYQSASDNNAQFYFWRYMETQDDPYLLDGKTYGLMSYSGGTSGKAMMAASSSDNCLDALVLTVLSKTTNQEDRLFVPDNSDISFWTFHWISQDQYYLSGESNGSTKYLRVDEAGLSLVSEPDALCKLKVIPGEGVYAGQIALQSEAATLTYSGQAAQGFSVGGNAGNEWLHFVEPSELTADFFMTYSASKVSVSDPNVTNGSRIIVYTRTWNDKTKKYDFYAIDHDGSLVRCFESGDSIQWVGNRINTLLWNLVEYYYEGTNEPNYYYDLYNQYSEQFLAPQLTDGQILSPDPIGVNLNGRRQGKYYSPIIAWDNHNYAYAGLKVENGKIVSCPFGESDDFYFARLQDNPVDDTFTTVPTIDHTQYGITMKLVDFNGNAGQNSLLGSSSGGAVTSPTQNLLSTNLGEDGYPRANLTGKSLGDLFQNAAEVNHLFIDSIYHGTGYYEFDSTQNFASINKDTGNFTVYKELGTMDETNKNSLKHGQFMPYNTLEAGVYASVNGKNLYTATQIRLPDSDPRKNEQMYLVKNPNYYFGLELEASFMQTANGLDGWGHDIIYEFTGDDDFWLYVDGELIIDLGGIHSALPGMVNYSTGQVSVNGTNTTLRALFENNYRTRNPEATDAEVAAFLSEYFDEGSTLFKDYTTHTMRIFFMERGAGASNLHMRFNLASVKPGTVQLKKELSGVDTSESVFAQFPYQIWLKTEDGKERMLTQKSSDPILVHFQDSIAPVPFLETLQVGSSVYENVFLLKPDEIAEIEIPDDAITYRIVECGVNQDVYTGVSVREDPALIETVSNGSSNRRDYSLNYASTSARPRVTYINAVDPNALRALTITKKLYNESGETELRNDSTTFSFRLSFGTEFASTLTPANMYTYHVKDPSGTYCRWNSENQAFVPLGTGKTDYASLSASEKKAVSFTTSMNGSISSIPAFYTVEIRELLAGTKFKVEERSNEIPDGYTLQKYTLGETDSSEPPQGTISVGEDKHVDVCNLRGWGLRVNKQWSDADYIAQRDPTYFAVFTEDASGNLTLVSGSVRQLNQNSTTLYWFFLPLPVTGISFDHYLIREVSLTDPNPTVNADGVVTNYGEVHPLAHGENLVLKGKHTGESSSAGLSYTVLYEASEIEPESNVRVDTVTNNRPGIILRKEDWNNSPLADAVFSLTDESDTLIGSFTSDAEGLITIAFLRDDVDYRLQEIRAPQGFHGLEAPMTLRLHEGSVTVSGIDADAYKLEQVAGSSPVLTIQNRPFTFQAVKLDGETREALPGVTFALHRQVTVDGVTSIDLNPMPGYENLTSDSAGLIPKLDNTLSAGVYELREKTTVSGYQKLASYVRFTVTATGSVILGSHPEDVTLASEAKSDGTYAYTMTISNHSSAKLIITKQVIGELGDRIKQFSFTLSAIENDDGSSRPWTKTAADGTTTSGTISVGGQFSLAHGETIEITMPLGKDITITEENGNYQVSWQLDEATPVAGSSISFHLSKARTLTVTNSLSTSVDTGIRTDNLPYVFTVIAALLLLLGSALMIVKRFRFHHVR